MALVVLILHQLSLIALMLFIAQFVVGLFGWQRRAANPVYRLIGFATQPFVRVARWITPRVVLDRHVPIVAFLLLAFAWAALSVQRVESCRANPNNPGCARLSVHAAADR